MSDDYIDALKQLDGTFQAQVCEGGQRSEPFGHFATSEDALVAAEEKYDRLREIREASCREAADATATDFAAAWHEFS
ncbi:hypothetical protein [Acidovorax sp.]|uniref:hypothetical protein n=1 Tax=Acidovorax sp. TaxID=1872122 RepID=UPI00391BEFC7